MAEQTSPLTRQQEIIKLWEKHNGLYVVVGILIGILIFPLLQLVFNNLEVLLEELVPEAVGIIFTVLLIDQLNRRRAAQEYKFKLFDQAKNRFNDIAVDALEKIQHASWWDEMLTHYSDEGRLNLSRVQWAGGIKLFSANLERAYLKEANLGQANLEYANLKQADLNETNLERASLYRVNLREANLDSANLTDANLRDAIMERASLYSANLQGADLRSANLAEGKLWNADLRGAILYNANLRGTNLMDANLEKAYLEEANLTGANLRGANLGRAYLGLANLEGADFWSADFAETVFWNANLAGADLRKANLAGAKLDNAKFDETTLLPDARHTGFDDKNKPIYDKYWVSDTDMTRYTDSEHPHFWQPDWMKDERIRRMRKIRE